MYVNICLQDILVLVLEFADIVYASKNFSARPDSVIIHYYLGPLQSWQCLLLEEYKLASFVLDLVINFGFHSDSGAPCLLNPVVSILW